MKSVRTFKIFIIMLLMFISLVHINAKAGFAKCIPLRVFTGGAISSDERQIAYGVWERRCKDKEASYNGQLWKMEINTKPALLAEYNKPLEPIGWLGETVMLKFNGMSPAYYLKSSRNSSELAEVPQLQGKKVLIKRGIAWYWGAKDGLWGLWHWEPGLSAAIHEKISGYDKDGELRDFWPKPNGKEMLIVLGFGKCEQLFVHASQKGFIRLAESCSGIPVRSQWSPDGELIAASLTDKSSARLLLFNLLGKLVGTRSSRWEPVMLSPWFLNDDPPRLGVIMPRALYQVSGGNSEDIHAVFAFPADVSFVSIGEQGKHLLIGMEYLEQDRIRGMVRMALYNIKDSIMQELF